MAKPIGSPQAKVACEGILHQTEVAGFYTTPRPPHAWSLTGRNQGKYSLSKNFIEDWKEEQLEAVSQLCCPQWVLLKGDLSSVPT